MTDTLQELIKYLDLAGKSLMMYAETHPRTQQAIDHAFALINQALENRKGLTVSIVEGNLLVEGESIEKGNPLVDRFSRDLFSRNINSLTFIQGITREELISLFRLLNMKPQRIRDLGGFENVLQSEGIKNVAANKIKFGIITEEGTAPTATDDVLSQVLLAVQMGMTGGSGSGAAAQTVEKAIEGSQAPDPAAMLFRVFQVIAQNAPTLPESEQQGPLKERFLQMFRSFTPQMQAKLLVSAVLKGAVLEKTPLSGFHQDLSPEELETSIFALVHELPGSEPDLKSLVAALEKDSSIALTEGARKKLQEAGLIAAPPPPPLWEEICKKDVFTPEDLAKTPEALRQLLADGNVNEADRLSKKMISYLSAGQPEQKVAAIKVLPSVTSTLSKNEKWKSVEFSLSLLVSTCFRKEANMEVLSAFLSFLLMSLDKNFRNKNFGGCNDLIATIRYQTDKHEPLQEELEHHLVNMTTVFSSELLEGSEGIETALNYLKLCRQTGAGFLLDLLTEEEDQRLRARLISLIEHLDHPHLLHQIEKRLADSRWYVVRNMVTILGRMHVAEAARLLQQAARHPDARIAKEIVKNLFRPGAAADASLILELLQHPDKSVRLQAVHLAAAANLHSATSLLLMLADSQAAGDSDLRAASLQTLLKMKCQEAIPVATALLEKKVAGKGEAAERNAAIRILGELSRAESRPLLEKIATSESNAETRALAASYL